MKRSEFVRLLREAYPYSDTMLEAGYALPQVMYATALELFRQGDVSSPAAVALREQIKILDVIGSLVFLPECRFDHDTLKGGTCPDCGVERRRARIG